MHKTKIDLSQSNREKLVDLLNAQLADITDLRMQAKQAHWNVKGPSFIALHELFDEVADTLTDHVDTIAERAVILGGTALGTVDEVSKTSSLAKYPTNIKTGKEHVDALSTALATYAKSVRAAIGKAEEFEDADTADLFTGVSRDVDKYLWFVEAHLQADA